MSFRRIPSLTALATRRCPLAKTVLSVKSPFSLPLPRSLPSSSLVLDAQLASSSSPSQSCPSPLCFALPDESSLSTSRRGFSSSIDGDNLPSIHPTSKMVAGYESQTVEISLLEGEGVRAEIGAMLVMDDGIEMSTGMQGGVTSGVKRFMSGMSFFVVDFDYKPFGEDREKQEEQEVAVAPKDEARVTFSANSPSKIFPLVLKDHGGSIVCSKGSFLVGAKGTEIEMHFTKSFTSGIFGGEGFVLQRLEGDGLVLLQAGGSLIERNLADGETIRVSPGSLVAFENTVDFDVKMVKGGKNIIFGGEGLFLSSLSGPGRVWLQSLPLSRLVEAIGSRARSGGMGLPLGMGMGGGGGGAGGEGGADEGGDDGGGAGADELGGGIPEGEEEGDDITYGEDNNASQSTFGWGGDEAEMHSEELDNEDGEESSSLFGSVWDAFRGDDD